MKDPEYDVEEIYELWSEQPVDVIKTCRHANLEPVWAGANMVAQLCLDCDAQLDADGSPIARSRDLAEACMESARDLQGPPRNSRIALVGPDRTPTAFHVPRVPNWRYRMALVVGIAHLSALVIFVLVTR